jgi:hypothetical protein
MCHLWLPLCWHSQGIQKNCPNSFNWNRRGISHWNRSAEQCWMISQIFWTFTKISGLKICWIFPFVPLMALMKNWLDWTLYSTCVGIKHVMYVCTEILWICDIGLWWMEFLSQPESPYSTQPCQHRKTGSGTKGFRTPCHASTEKQDQVLRVSVQHPCHASTEKQDQVP